jgi:hypothetical protein
MAKGLGRANVRIELEVAEATEAVRYEMKREERHIRE